MQKTINFVCEKSDDKVSGGYIYNDHLLSGLQQKGYEILHYDASNIANVTPASYTIVDSISVNDVAHRLVENTGLKNTILLCHLPPEMQVRYENSDSRLIESATSRFVKEAFIVFTGTSCEDYMKPMYQLKSSQHCMIKPGLLTHWQSKHSFPILPKKLMVAASLIPNKGYELLLSSLKAIEALPWRLAIYGESTFSIDYANDILKLISKFGLEHRISYEGAVDQLSLNKAMVDADLMIHLSQYEPYSMVSLEAIHANLPILSSVSGEYSEFARSGKVKYIESYDVDGCSSALTQLLTEPSEYAKLCHQRKQITRTWSDVADDFEALFQTMSTHPITTEVTK